MESRRLIVVSRTSMRERALSAQEGADDDDAQQTLSVNAECRN
jgi:hypothetical protein